jgi:hypothetical protein
MNPIPTKSCAILFALRSRNLLTHWCLHWTEPASPKVVGKPGRTKRWPAWIGGFMGSMKQWMLGAALAVGALGLSAAPAHAARVGIYVGAPAAYIPPCPGAGYVWVAGYWANGYWVPGYWNYVGIGPRLVVRGGFGWDRGPVISHRGFDRHPAPERFRR